MSDRPVASRPTGSRTWKLARLRAMSPAEILWRTGRAVRGTAERVRLAPVAPARLPRAIVRPDVGVLFPRCAENDHALVAAEYPDVWRRTLIADADRILSGEVPFFGRWARVGCPPAWRTDPVSGRDAGLPFYTALLHPSEARVGDYRAVWEINRHASLVTLARAAYITGEKRYADACEEFARTFVDQNPTARGINWTSGLEVALRAIAWTGAWCFLEAGGFAHDDMRRTWARTIARCAGYVRTHIAAYSSANNHLMGEAAALVVVGSVCPTLPSARRWRRHGAEIVARETLRQIHRDGVGAEQSVHYLTFTAELIALSTLCAARVGEPLPSEVLGRLTRAGEFLHALRDARGHRPVLGDSDDAVALPLGVGPHAMPDAIVSLVRGIHAEDAAHAIDESTYWLLSSHLDGSHASATHAQVARFLEGGVAVARAGSTVTVLDTGPLGYLSLAAHGHADPLARWVSFDGRPAIIDPGTGSYAPSRRAERDYFRSARAHATVVVDECEPADIRGAFLWGARYNCALRFAAGDEEWSVLEGEHDGFRRVRCAVRRRVHVDPSGYLLVVDAIDSSREHTYTVSWPCAPEFTVDPAASTEAAHVLVAPDGDTIAVATRAVWRDASGEEGAVECTHTSVRASEDPLDGWASLEYDAVVPCTIVRSHVRAGPGWTVLVSLVSPARAHASLRTVRAAGSRSVSATIQCGTEEHEWLVLLGGSPAHATTPEGTLDYAGERASVRIARAAGDVSVTARGSGEFRVRDRTVRNDDEWTWRLANAARAALERGMRRSGVAHAIR